ncbi:MAG: 2-hydroxyacyl-CoA dehydratase subunit D, partial [Dethiobacteria bacterium]
APMEDEAEGLGGKLDFLDGLIISHSCDMVQRLYGIWTYYHPLPYSYLFNVPHQVTPWAQRFYKRELGFFRESLENFTGRSVSDEKLRNVIVLQNKNRAIIRALYDLRKENPPRLEGSEMLKLLMAGGTQPSGSFNRLLLEKEAFFAARKPGSGKKPRIMIWGSIMDDPALFEIIEEAGGTIVADDTCIGFRVWEKDVPETADPYDGLTEHYFVNFQCPRTDRGPGVKRFDYLLQRAREYNVDGVVGYCISFCDPHKFDYPDLRDYLKKEGLPLLLIDDNYSFEPAEAIKTRLQAFLEML